MKDHIAYGHAFVVDDLWQRPSLLVRPNKQHTSIFESLDTSTTSLNLPTSEEAPHFLFDTDLSDLPALDGAPETRVQPEETSIANTEERQHLDIWNLDHEAVDLYPYSDLCTWEAFNGKSVAGSQTTCAFLSEAGQFAYDALDRATNKCGVLPQGYVLRALSSLAHGRSSALFRWSDESGSFFSVLESVSISGISQVCTESLTKDMIQMGTAIVRLRNFCDVAYASRIICPAVVGMQNGIASALDAIDDVVRTELCAIRSLLQLQRIAVRPQLLLHLLVTLVESIKDCETDERLISSVSDRIRIVAETNQNYSAVLQALLARISVPWLERLSAELGLSITTPALVGAPLDEESMNVFSRETHSFLDDVDIDLMRETKMAVALLRKISPDHSLLNGRSSVHESALRGFIDPSLSIRQTKHLAQAYEAQFMLCVDVSPTRDPILAVGLPIEQESDVYSHDALVSERSISGLEELMSRDINQKPKSATDELHTLVGLACQTDSVEVNTCTVDLSMSAYLTPLERVRPFVSTQSRLVNGILLRQLLRGHQLRKQLLKQKQFQLLGNGHFVTRLSTALFSLEVQSAERKQGVVPTGEVMGLRLGSSPDQRWPPASSELRLTLAGVLEESQSGLAVGRASESPGEQIGSLSFAIRELPEEEIDRVLDAHSVHALDFLRLQYVPSPPVDSVLSPEAMHQYDVVFRFLLKLLRQMHVVKSLPRQTAGGRGDAISRKVTMFANQSQHFVSTLMAHSMELGINVPWRRFMVSMEQLELALKEEDRAGKIGTKATIGILGLKQMHEACLDRVRGRLLLKRKHTKLRVAMEAVFSAILKVAAVVSADDKMGLSTFEEQNTIFRKACAALCEMLQHEVAKPPKVMSAIDSEDADTIRALLLKLNWNDFYTNVGHVE